jgi:hypothetical protein
MDLTSQPWSTMEHDAGFHPFFDEVVVACPAVLGDQAGGVFLVFHGAGAL